MTTRATDLLLPQGIHSARPASGAKGALYSCTTHSLVYQWDGTTWQTWATLGSTGGGTPAFAGVKAYHSAAQSIPNAATTALLLDSEEYDTGGFHDTTTNTSRLTVPTGKGGYYLLQGGSSGLAVAQASTEVLFRKNGTTNIRSAVGGAGDGHINVSAVVNLTAGDYVELVCFQSSGAAKTIGNTTGADNQTWAAATLLGT